MTSITIRTDEDVKNYLAHKAKVHGLTLSGYINLVFRQHITRDEGAADELDDDIFISEERWAKELAIAEARLNDPNTKWYDADEVLAELNKEYDIQS